MIYKNLLFFRSDITDFKTEGFHFRAFATEAISGNGYKPLASKLFS